MKKLFFARHWKILIAGIFILVFACTQAVERRNTSLIANDKTLFMEIRQADSVTLYWDSPMSDTEYSVKYYELLYRTIRDTTLTLLKSNIPPLQNPVVVVHRSEIVSTDSLFYFGVRFVPSDGIASPIHFSYDSTAVPKGGWFIFWEKK